MMLPTGGTTGTPKAVPVTNRQMLMLCWAFGGHFAEPEPPRYICATPMTHAAGGCALPVIAEGGSVIIHQGVDPAEIFASIERNRATRMFLPPTAVYALLGHPAVRRHDFSSLRNFLVSAAPIAPERLAEAVEVFGPVMCQAYGQAESPMICTVFTALRSSPRRPNRCCAAGSPRAVDRPTSPGWRSWTTTGTCSGPKRPARS
jgi:acyl-CoA synthetase (AMP-forming)/AMP-acid ligase II